MTYVTNPAVYNQLGELFNEWITRRNRQPLSGSRKIDEARKEGETLGYDRGVGAALATHVNMLRCQMYEKIKFVPILVELDVLADILKPALAKYKEMFPDAKPAASKEERIRRNELKQEWLNWCVEKVSEVAFTEELEEAEKRRHQEAVLAREEPPTEADREWLAEKLAKAKSMWDEIARLIPEQAKE